MMEKVFPPGNIHYQSSLQISLISVPYYVEISVAKVLELLCER